jgi:serine/threonine protein kinase
MTYFKNDSTWLYKAKKYNCDDRALIIKHRTSSNEIKYLQRVGQHPNIVGLHGYIIYSQAYAMLQDLLLPNDPTYPPLHQEALEFTYHSLRALTKVHSQGIVHLDLKPTNFGFQFRTKQWVLFDFDLAHEVKNGQQLFLQNIGTEGYQAPEVIDGTQTIGFPADLWSLAATIEEKYAVSTHMEIATDGHTTWNFLGHLLQQLFAEDPLSRPTARKALSIVREFSKHSN